MCCTHCTQRRIVPCRAMPCRVHRSHQVSGASTDHSPDEMAADAAAAALDSGSAHEGGGDATAMPLLGDWGITPTEATVVLLDISSSMDMQAHAGDDTLTRLDAVKSLFNSFVDRSLAYQLPHVVGLVLFGTRARIECPITEAFELFMVRDALPRPSAPLFKRLSRRHVSHSRCDDCGRPCRPTCAMLLPKARLRCSMPSFWAPTCC